MRLVPVLVTLAALAVAGCSSVIDKLNQPLTDTLSADVWLCAYQIGDRYRDDAVKPTVVNYDTITSAPARRTTLTYLVPVAEGVPPVKHTLTCDAAPYGYGIVAEDGFRLQVATPVVYPGNAVIDPTVQGRVAEQIREEVARTGLHVAIAGIPSF